MLEASLTRPERDVVDTVLGFARTLRHAGVGASPDRVEAMMAALGSLDVLDPTAVYWAGRLTLCSGPDDLDRYDAAFAAYFAGEVPRAGRPSALPPVQQLAASAPLELGTGDVDDAPDSPELAVQASPDEVLRHRDVADLTAAERDHLRRLFALLAPATPMRPSRRRRPSLRGAVHPARTVRSALRDGGEVRRLLHHRRQPRPRRVVLLVDVSGSMSPYADALLRFAHAAVRAWPASTEVFTIGTRLTRVTREMRQRDPDKALAASGSAIPDWSGGTRLGEVLKAFLDRWGQRGTARGAVVVFCSDGWERGGTDLLAQQMVRLRRLAHSVVWVNPHKGRRGYEPLTGGMQAALPSVDHFVSGHSMAAFEELTRVIQHA
ncbi:VWA domain-containing protein [Blastococcus sp. CT_GayMR20]|uniref:vWA domain-containing protein n=1 Tax=Blastococcus sp. CT_GayMR20 TaxID=2559609 RepID=UPI00107376BE|nr:VWA domain-containing protein [Blastococcus sp. CT_GayMR20]TFV91794.1 VWA domain-containing protein [Blastococcus sp. CT_GayMR20]TFV91806.1 VWA domain-containing protein [Blastococcus sp. CT_GayMR20]